MSQMPAMLDARSFGAVGDGKTDSTAALPGLVRAGVDLVAMEMH